MPGATYYTPLASSTRRGPFMPKHDRFRPAWSPGHSWARALALLTMLGTVLVGSGCGTPTAPPVVDKQAAGDPSSDQELKAEIHSLVTEVESVKTTVAELSQRLGRLEHEKAVAARGKAISVEEQLRKRITITFPRNTLEVALKLLSGDIGVPLVIRSGDLQLEGITKNQSFGMDERDQPAEAILLTILKRANPDGKLVYIIENQPDVGERIVVTTRAAAASRGDTLPAALREPSAR